MRTLHVTLKKAIEGVVCGYRGKGGGLCKIDERGAYVILDCGCPIRIHVGNCEEMLGVVVAECAVCGRYGAIEGVCWFKDCSPTLPVGRLSRRKKMAGRIPGKGGSIPINGMEAVVHEYKVKHAFMSLLEEELDQMKARFREQAIKIWEESEIKPKELRFIGDKGAAVSVTMPDLEAPSSRCVVSDKLIRELLGKGIDLDDLGVTEVIEDMRLEGEWVGTVRAIIDQYYVSQGVEVPAGIHERTTRKLSKEGLEKLRKMRDETTSTAMQEGLSLLLTEAVKSPTVKVD